MAESEIWVEKPCVASAERGYLRQVVVVDDDVERYVIVRPAPGARGVTSRMLREDLLRRFVKQQDLMKGEER